VDKASQELLGDMEQPLLASNRIGDKYGVRICVSLFTLIAIKNYLKILWLNKIMFVYLQYENDKT
jgi:hypothetical protein